MAVNLNEIIENEVVRTERRFDPDFTCLEESLEDFLYRQDELLKKASTKREDN
jgi:hypothetical protein